MEKKGEVSGEKNAVAAVANKYEICEQFCFVCKDLGDHSYYYCDYPGCLKVYHPECLNKDESFWGSEVYWACDWHTCYNCSEASAFYCYTCKYAVCPRCVHDSEFSLVRGRYGFCSKCLDIVQVLEEHGKGYDLGFFDPNRYYGRFESYYKTIRIKQGLRSRDIRAVKDRSNNSVSYNTKRKREPEEETENKSPRKDEDPVPLPLPLYDAAIVPENIELLYLRKGLIRELLKQPESFEEKVVGCYVRIILNPKDRRSLHSFRLMQIKGVKNLPSSETNGDTVLQFTDVPEETSVNDLSEGDFTEEECKILREKVVSGQLERPTITDLEKKAKIIVKDRMNYKIDKELALLPHLIDRANEKGWRGDLFDYIERRRILKDPSERQKMLEYVPNIVNYMVEPGAIFGPND
ncbi:zinc finger CCCH domain-containing protein 19-like [Andrographis paniculata]|uniref:zinc finger CCCH domain-containing protein 19-like n=1 Tax=Andrographis paniculata TaxID=175694 RepID=UPI0021E9A7F7|nr:zinc finger CCCH domain-containing protein 19-like [Andrographis paniculata]